MICSSTHKRAFTLIELLVVIDIIAILAAMPNSAQTSLVLNPSSRRSRTALSFRADE